MNVKQDVLSLTSIHWVISVAVSKYPHFCLTGKVTQALGSALERFWVFLERNDKRNTFPMATHSYSCTLTNGGLIWVFLSGEIPATRDVTVALCLQLNFLQIPLVQEITPHSLSSCGLTWSFVVFRRRTILMAETNLPPTEATTLN